MGKSSASFEVELLPAQKAVAHKRLGVYDAPDLMSYARGHMKEYGKLFVIEGFVLAYASCDEIDRLSDDQGLIEFKNWAEKNFPNSHGYRSPGLTSFGTVYRWIRMPNGLWVIPDLYNRWITWDQKPEKGGIKNDPKGDISKANYVDAQILDNFDWESQRRYEKLCEEFEGAWKAARNKYRKQLKKSGKAETREAEEAKKNHVERTKVRMKVLKQATKLQDLLEVYIKCVNDESMTVSQIGDLYRELTKLGALNKDMKTIYGTLIKKK